MTDLSNENIHIEDNEENDQNIDIVNRQRRRPNKGQEKPTQEPKKRGRPSTNNHRKKNNQLGEHVFIKYEPYQNQETLINFKKYATVTKEKRHARRLIPSPSPELPTPEPEPSS